MHSPEQLLADSSVLRLVQIALQEDIGSGDITTESLFAEMETPLARGEIVFKQPGVVCGLPIAALVFRELSAEVLLEPKVDEGSEVDAGAVVAEVIGPAPAILTAERTALNFLQRMSGVATLTRRFVKAVEGTGARITDTRKTIPGMAPPGQVRHRNRRGGEPPDGALRHGAHQGQPHCSCRERAGSRRAVSARLPRRHPHRGRGALPA